MGSSIAVVLPFRNARPWLAEVIVSLVNAAAGLSWQLIAVDDGSYDDGARLLLHITRHWPDGQLLLSIDEAGRALLVARQRRVLLHHFSFKGPVAAAAFSPDGRHIAVAVGRLLQVRAGSVEREGEAGGDTSAWR